MLFLISLLVLLFCAWVRVCGWVVFYHVPLLLPVGILLFGYGGMF